MDPIISTIIAFIIGTLISHWLSGKFLMAKHDIATTALRSTHDIKVAELNGLSISQAQDVARLKQENSNLNGTMEKIRAELKEETQNRSAAEERTKNITGLESQLAEKEKKIEALLSDVLNISTKKQEIESQLSAERENIEKQKKNLEDMKTSLLTHFKSASADSLKDNNQTFLTLAKETFEGFNKQAKGDLEQKQQAIDAIVNPIKETLIKFENKIEEVEKVRIDAYSGITTQFNNMRDTQEKLRHETASLVKALRTPQARGRWGEIQLKRVVEMAGMIDHCDFVEQPSIDTEEGRLRPDLIVKLPGGKNIIVDSKAVIDAYIEASATDDDVLKKSKLQDHARHIRDRVANLSTKKYWDQFEHSPEFVVLFLPGESFFSSALEIDPSLIEQSVDQKVIIATPTTLIALLKAVAYGWKQTALAANAKEISDLGRDLYDRVTKMAEHFASLGKNLGKAVESYNSTMGTLETRVLSAARKFKDLKVATEVDDIDALEPIDNVPRELQAKELKILPQPEEVVTEES